MILRYYIRLCLYYIRQYILEEFVVLLNLKTNYPTIWELTILKRCNFIEFEDKNINN